MNTKNLLVGFVGIVVLGALLSTLIGPWIWSAQDDDYLDQEDQQDVMVVTLNATMISTDYAMLNGELVDMKDYSSVEVYFVWGYNSGEYTNETSKQTLTSPGEFSIEISDLFIPDNTYYFQARSDPEGKGKEVSFYVN